ncbi:MAG: hypothetical protein ACI93R_002783 [Flavobacteriales bacterium]|jgi:hypothetical protein
MNNRNWLLNAAAIRAARACIKAVEKELGVRLTLAHPDFLELLGEYSELTDSAVLKKAVLDLTAHAADKPRCTPKSKVVSISSFSASIEVSASGYAGDNRRTEFPNRREELVAYHGKDYHRWHNGCEFKGLYRGQARYA